VVWELQEFVHGIPKQRQRDFLLSLVFLNKEPKKKRKTEIVNRHISKVGIRCLSQPMKEKCSKALYKWKANAK
jgi:hypothetical protein